MKTALITHPACLEHQVPPGNPEIPERLSRVLEALDTPEFGSLIRLEAPAASDADIARIHGPDFWPALIALEPDAPGRFVALAPDAHLHAGTIEATRRVCGASLRAVREIAAGEYEAAFCAVRPPGHHAEPDAAMGFCFANGAAIAAASAIEEGFASRAAVIDFDVHHGNGTQAAFWDRADLFYGSTHKSPLYPGTGRANETGAKDTIRNAPYGEIDATAWRELTKDAILKPLEAFAPDFLIISAGFDAHRDDPLGAGPLTEDDFAWMTKRLVEIARHHGKGRLVSILEGGYDLDALARSSAAHVRVLLNA